MNYNLIIIFHFLTFSLAAQSDSLCIAGVLIGDSLDYADELPGIFSVEIYEGEMEPGSKIRRTYSDSIVIFEEWLESGYVLKAIEVRCFVCEVKMGKYRLQVGQSILSIAERYPQEFNNYVITIDPTLLDVKNYGRLGNFRMPLVELTGERKGVLNAVLDGAKVLSITILF